MSNLRIISDEDYQAIITELKDIKAKIDKPKSSSYLPDQWIDNSELMIILKVDRRTVQKYRDSGELPYSKIGAKLYYKAQDVQSFLESNMSNRRNTGP